MSFRLAVVLDEWLQPGMPDTLIEFCAHVYAATPPGCRNRWVMDQESFRAIQAQAMMQAVCCYQNDPKIPAMLFGVPVIVQDAGGLPHLE